MSGNPLTQPSDHYNRLCEERTKRWSDYYKPLDYAMGADLMYLRALAQKNDNEARERRRSEFLSRAEAARKAKPRKVKT